MSRDKILIIDGNNNYYRAYFANMNLSYEGKNIGAIFQFPRIISSLKKLYTPTKIIICWDGRSSDHRTTLLPTYRVRDKKVNLRFDLEDFLYQKKYVMKMAYLLGIDQLYNKEIEADDYIYHLTKKYLDKNNRVIIVSTDKDFNQLICPGCSIHNEKVKKLIHHKNAKKVLGYRPDQTVDYLSILGDDSDKIPGYKGMGEKRTLEFLATWDKIENYLSSDKGYKKLDKDKMREIYLLNRKLIDLKLFNESHELDITHYKNKINPIIQIDRFRELCIKFGIRELRKPDFIRIFKPDYEL